ncbi:interleukin-22 receptor subunit alpha-1 [Varanus komodoensis]|uniref:interleukin-22 receptor subunit alpha-1 n=1 Tax=Varanus komodoensis TaxID=61221 RepID=UPI001CF79D97|nr:interleukin-22 receptor subunit alpha-1 [Varanus komodoensis]
MKDVFIFWLLCSLLENSLAERSPLILQPRFLSTNFENIFTWTSGEKMPPGTVYEVQYKRYGEAWQNKSECQNITQRFCDLTHETENYMERYHARVRAVTPGSPASSWAMSPRFCPREDTNIGVPEVNCTPRTQSIKFSVRAPDTPLRDEENQTLTVVDIFSQFGALVQYEITVFCQKTQQQWTKSETNREFEIPDLAPDTEYNGTIHIRYLDKISQPFVFRVRTVPDKTWLPYLFGLVLFTAVAIFGTLYYLTYKYVKRRPAWPPTSLDFKSISLHFQPLCPDMEHIWTVYNFSKSIQHCPEIQPMQVSQHLLDALEPQKSLSWTETVYQQQAKTTLFQTTPQPVSQADDLPVGYAPQVARSNPPRALGDSPATLTYGMCVDGTSCVSKTTSPPNPVMKLDSSLGASIRNAPYKVQKPEQSERELWEGRTQRQPAMVWEDAQLLLLQEDAPTIAQQLLWAPATADERAGSYRKQAVQLPPATSELSQSTILEGGPLCPALPPPSVSPCDRSSLLQDHNLRQWAAWESFAWTDNQHLGVQMSDCTAQASFGTGPDTVDSAPNDELFTGLFRDLELKLQWDDGSDETPAVY